MSIAMKLHPVRPGTMAPPPQGVHGRCSGIACAAARAHLDSPRDTGLLSSVAATTAACGGSRTVALELDEKPEYSWLTASATILVAPDSKTPATAPPSSPRRAPPPT